MKNEVRPCWYFSEYDYLRNIREQIPLPNQSAASELFLITLFSSERIEGFLGRLDRKERFFSRMENGFSYFDDYQSGKKLYFSFDKSIIYEVVEIHPEDRLRFVLEWVRTISPSSETSILGEHFGPRTMLLDLVEGNPEYLGFVKDFLIRQKNAGYFLSNRDFIQNEIHVFERQIKAPSVELVTVNDMPPVKPFNISTYSLKTFEYARSGHNLNVSQLVEQAKRECESAKADQLHRFGRLFAYASCTSPSFDGMAFRAIRRGVGFALYIKYLTDLTPVSATSLKSNASVTEIGSSPSFGAIFQDINAMKICEELLEEMEVTFNGKCRLTPGKSGILAGVIIAVKQTPGMLKKETFTEKELLLHFNTRLQTEFKSLPKRSLQYNAALDDARRFLKQHFSKK